MATVLVALGGNALLSKGQKPSVSTQLRTAHKTFSSLFPLFKKHHVLITHGNGPQVGSILLRSELAHHHTYDLPLSVCNAQSQGEIGFILEESLRNVFSKKRLKKEIASLITMVVVSPKDPAFRKPSKPIGAFYTKAKAAKLARQRRGIIFKEDSGRGYRRVVPSPEPKKTIPATVIKQLLKRDLTVIASGGGGIPVYKTSRGWQGLDAVIDKDKASACLAHEVGADQLIMVTGIPFVYLNFQKKGQKAIKKMTVKQARAYLKQGHFAEGSMKPKIVAAIRFLTQSRKKKSRKVIITSPTKITQALLGKAGTTILP